MEYQKESTLYEFIEMQKNVQAANLKLKKKEELIVIRNWLSFLCISDLWHKFTIKQTSKQKSIE